MITIYTTCHQHPLHFVQGRRKQFFSGLAKQLQSYVYSEFRVMSGHKCKLLCSMHSMLMLGVWEHAPQENFEK